VHRCDPGPCPVDDAPHTTCVGPSPEIALAQLPARDQPRTPRSAHPISDAPIPVATARTFTTGSYRRATVRAALAQERTP
jgi:hypothetical protein